MEHQIANLAINRQRLIDRFLRYVAVDTSADGDSNTYPSSPNQRTLAKIVADDLKAIEGIDVEVDEYALVWGTVRASDTRFAQAPTVLFNSHLDTSPEAPGASIKTRILQSYNGGPIELGHGIEISDSNTPELSKLIGKTLIVTDGQTLLGGDDKAGVAVIVEFVTTILEQKLPHGPLQILFTCDEEIGRGTDRVDMKKCIAEVGYTLDGSGQGIIEDENFSADMATVIFRGNNIHPAIAKGKMINALRAAATFASSLPLDHLSPETTDDREGFLHPYHLDGHVGQACLKILLRDFDTLKLTEYRRILEELAQKVRTIHPGIEIELQFSHQYRNMADGLKKRPETVSLALKAYEMIGVTAERDIIRGGTDGAMFTAKGLPMPNLATGQHNIHSVREFVCVDEMETAVRHLLALAGLWASQSAPESHALK
jgi:tripeptide aminopeptidase